MSGTQPGKTSESRRFVVDIIWVGLVQLLNSLVLGLVTFPFLTKHYTSEIFGVWNQVNLTVILLTIVLTLQLGVSLVRFLASDEDKGRRRRAVGSMLLTIIVVSCPVFVAADLFAPRISSLLFASPNYVLFVRLTIAWIFTNSLFYFFGMYLRARNKIKLLSILQLIYSLVSMALIIGLSSTGFALSWVIALVIATQAVFVALFLTLIVIDVGIPTPNFSGLKSYLAFCLPQIPGAVLLWVIGFSDRYFITHFLGLSQAGIYTPSFNLASLTSLFYSPIGFVLFPLVTRLWDEKRFSDVKTYIEYSTKLFLTLAVPAAAGLAIISQQLLYFLATPEFLAGRAIVLLIAIGLIFQGIYYIHVNVVYLLKKTKILPFMIITAAAISIILNIILIPHVGLLGAAFSDIAAYFALATIITVYVSKAMHLSIDYKYVVKLIFAAGVMAAVLHFLPISGTLGIVPDIIIGAAIFGVTLFLLRAFSQQDRQIIRELLNGLAIGRRGG